jgi:hypothetical protein
VRKKVREIGLIQKDPDVVKGQIEKLEVLGNYIPYFDIV